MFVSTLFVMLTTVAGPTAPDAAPPCTEPLLSYYYDSAVPGDHTVVTCLICETSTTWRTVDAYGAHHVTTHATPNIAHLRDAVNDAAQGEVRETPLGGAGDAPTVFFWAHTEDAGKFLLYAGQNATRWTNRSAETEALLPIIQERCAPHD